MAVERLASLKLQDDWINKKDQWWNKLLTMTEHDFDMLPIGFMRKYGSYMTNLTRYNRDFHLEENKNISDYFKQIKHLKKL